MPTTFARRRHSRDKPPNCSRATHFGLFRVQRPAVRFGEAQLVGAAQRIRRSALGLGIVSLIVLAILGALGGLILSRVFARGAARNEDVPGDNKGEQERQQADLSEDNKRSIRFFLGAAAAVLAILIDVAIVGGLVASIVFNRVLVLTSGFPVIFFVVALALAGYLLGARKLGIAAIGFTAVAVVLTVIVTIMQEGG